MPKKRILKKIGSFVDPEYNNYYGWTSEDGFVIAEKNMKHYIGGHSQNSFAPVARAKITESDGMTTISMVIRMNIFVMFVIVPLYLISLFTVVLFPFMHILLHFAFFKPAKRLKETVETLLSEDDFY